MDIPNKRSSHEVPLPVGGGIAIVATFYLGLLLVYFIADVVMVEQKIFWGFTFSSLLIAAISFYDDFSSRPFFIKLLSQIIAVSFVMFLGIVIHRIDFPWIGTKYLGAAGYVVTLLWMVGLINTYNFMDGLNGMAGGNAIIAAVFFCIISYSKGSNFVYIISYLIIAGTSGFIVFNFPKARLFMGDVGSTFLGFLFAILAIIAALYDHSHTSLLVVPLLLFHFIYDTFFTFIRRLIRKENVFKAHRTHLYQLFNQLGYSHTIVSIFYFAVGIAQGFGAWRLVNMPGTQRILVFMPYLIIQIIYSIIIIYNARRASLI